MSTACLNIELVCMYISLKQKYYDLGIRNVLSVHVTSMYEWPADI